MACCIFLSSPESEAVASPASESSCSSAYGVTPYDDTLTFCYTFVGVELSVSSADRSINPGTRAKSTTWTLSLATNFDSLHPCQTAVGICHSIYSAYWTVNQEAKFRRFRATWTLSRATNFDSLRPCKTAVGVCHLVYSAYRTINIEAKLRP